MNVHVHEEYCHTILLWIPEIRTEGKKFYCKGHFREYFCPLYSRKLISYFVSSSLKVLYWMFHCSRAIGGQNLIYTANLFGSHVDII